MEQNVRRARAAQIQFEEPGPLIAQSAYALWDLGVVWAAADWQVGLHVKNLIDKACKVACLNIYDLGFEGNATGYSGDPRPFWLDLQNRFHRWLPCARSFLRA